MVIEYDKLQRDLDRYNSPKPNPEEEELMAWFTKATLLHEEALAGDPYVTTWLRGRGLTSDDVEAEVQRLRRAIQGQRVGPPTIDIPTMDTEINQKKKAFTRLAELDLMEEGLVKGERWALERMRAKGILSLEELAKERESLEATMGDPIVSERFPWRIRASELYEMMMRASKEELKEMLRILEEEQKKKLTLDKEEFLGDLKALVKGRLTALGDPLVEPERLRDDLPINAQRLADYIQTEAGISWGHRADRRWWEPMITIEMAMEEPMVTTGRLLGLRASKVDGWAWTVHGAKAPRVLKRVEDYLMADKLEMARYVISISEKWKHNIPDTELRPHYRAVINGRIQTVYLYPEFVDFPLKYGVLVRKGEELPRPLREEVPLKYTPEGRPIYWHEGMHR